MGMTIPWARLERFVEFALYGDCHTCSHFSGSFEISWVSRGARLSQLKVWPLEVQSGLWVEGPRLMQRCCACVEGLALCAESFGVRVVLSRGLIFTVRVKLKSIIRSNERPKLDFYSEVKKSAKAFRRFYHCFQVDWKFDINNSIVSKTNFNRRYNLGTVWGSGSNHYRLSALVNPEHGQDNVEGM